VRNDLAVLDENVVSIPRDTESFSCYYAFESDGKTRTRERMADKKVFPIKQTG